MNFDTVLYPILGGALIGLAVTFMLLFNGRVTGISGILSSSLSTSGKDGPWRWLFLAGMISGGVLMNSLRPEFFTNLSGRGLILNSVAGLLVGYGTVMGSGCTSGHGVCGISRLSLRSLIATATFMLFGFLSVQLFFYLTGGQA